MEAAQATSRVHEWAQHGDYAQLQACISADANSARARDAEDITPLHWAAINGHAAVCTLLLDSGAEVDAPGGTLGATPLQWSIR